MTKNRSFEPQLDALQLEVGGLTFPDALERLLRNARAKEVTFEADRVVFEQDSQGEEAYYLVSGTVSIERTAHDGQPHLLAILGPGNLFGEMALLDRTVRSATARTESRCKVFEIPRAQVLELVREVPQLTLWLLHVFSHRLRVLDRQVDEMERLHEVNTRIIVGQEDERKRIARDIHDGPAQCFADYMMRLQIVQKLMRKNLDLADQEIVELRESLGQGLEKLRELIYTLHPKEIVSQGLETALQRVAERISARAGFAVDLTCSMETDELERHLQSTIFCLVQEGLNNVGKHASASRVEITLRPEGSVLELVIRDDGVGFDVKELKTQYAQRQSIGLLGMAERVALVRGTMEIDSSPGKGTTLRFRMPARNTKGT